MVESSEPAPGPAAPGPGSGPPPSSSEDPPQGAPTPPSGPPARPRPRPSGTPPSGGPPDQAALHAADLERQIRNRSWVAAIAVVAALFAAGVAIWIAIDARDNGATKEDLDSLSVQLKGSEVRSASRERRASDDALEAERKAERRANQGRDELIDELGNLTREVSRNTDQIATLDKRVSRLDDDVSSLQSEYKDLEKRVRKLE